ncbi:hypothetical protein ES708_14268 [subsurface metagenome]
MPVGLKVSDIIAISGHRDYPDRASFLRGLDNLRAREYIFGGARGADSDALYHIARTQPKAIRTVIVPNRAIDQPVSARQITSQHATRVIELKNTGAGRFQIRNRAMVDRSTHLRAFYDFRGSGGTLNTIEYARSKGKSFDTAAGCRRICKMLRFKNITFMLCDRCLELHCFYVVK